MNRHDKRHPEQSENFKLTSPFGEGYYKPSSAGSKSIGAGMTREQRKRVLNDPKEANMAQIVGFILIVGLVILGIGLLLQWIF